MKGNNLANGSTTAKRRALDFYPTPPEVTRALIETGLIPRGMVWEPACGEGHMSDVLLRAGHNVTSSDIRDTGYGWKADFLTHDLPVGTTAIITNPPFKDSAAFIERALGHGVEFVAMLLKSQYWHAAKRRILFEASPPAYVYALTWRPDFMMGKRGGAPTMECLWTVWIQGQSDTKYRLMAKPTDQYDLVS